MKDWYLRQTPRDRLIVIAVMFFTLIGLAYLFIWFPLSSGLESNRTILTSKQTELQRIEVAAQRLKALGGGAGVQRKQSSKAPYLLIDEVIRTAGLNQPERLEPSGSGGNGARVQFSEVSFDKLVVILAELELYGLEVKTMNITRKNPGTVSARFNMEKS